MNKVLLTERSANDDAANSNSSKKLGLSDALYQRKRPLRKHLDTSGLI